MTLPWKKADLARLVGLTKQAVSEACLRGALKPACVGPRVDLAHPVAREWLREHGVDPDEVGLPQAKKQAEPNEATSAEAAAPAFAGPRDIGELMHMTVAEVVRQFGTEQGFADWVAVKKQIAHTRKIELANEQIRGQLISRELVKTHVFGMLEATNLRLLRDTPKTLARRLYTLAKAGAPLEEAEATIHDHISAQLKTTKAQVVKALRAKA